ncbi:hypothetical protein [Nocardioides sp.]|uniref:hypothetical protein n=1 Tax=Nocardioides sp. TaxID=35761 RepID=UPI0025E9B2B2|nr:hypothetical protein [Nocardioides sp.]
MLVRRVPAIVLSLVLGAAALVSAPIALASDGGNATDVQKDRDTCGAGTSTRAKLKVGTLEGNDSRLLVVGTVWSSDSDVWVWKLKHNGEVSDDGRARGDEEQDLSFRVIRTMINFYGADDIVFRAENQRTGEVCRTSLSY